MTSAIAAAILARRKVCGCGAVHYATACHICKVPALEERERQELLEIYHSLNGLHHLSFNQCLESKLLLGCLRNTAKARRKARAELAAQTPANFELQP